MTTRYALAAKALLTPPAPTSSSAASTARLYAGAAIDPATGKLCEYGALLKGSEGAAWTHATALEFGRLAQGVGADIPTGSDTIFFIDHAAKPAHKKATYCRVVATDRPQKIETKRVRLTVGGDRIQYDGDLATPTAGLTTVKLHLNSTISTPNARYCTIDIKDFYLGTPMTEYEYMRIPISLIPEVIIRQYNLLPLVHNGFVIVEVRKGMYGLPQAGILANKQLRTHLATQGYSQVPLTPGLFRHVTRDISFTLVVDDFGVKYTSRADLTHLISTIQQKYTATVDTSGTLYCGLTLAWDYTNRHVDISMPGYVERCLARFRHNISVMPRPQHSPHAWIKPNYGARTQLTPAPDTSPRLSPAETTIVQEVVGTLLYYGRAIDATILVALGSIGTQQAKPTQTTKEAIEQLLSYVASHPDATVRYHASGMVLHLHSDASYLSETGARSRAGGYFFLSSGAPHPTSTPLFNGAILILSTIIKNILASAAEAELGALFYNAREAVPIRITLLELGHPQPPTTITTDNACAAGIANDSVKLKRSKAIDMRFYWIRDRVRQGQFHVRWAPGSLNRADYFTKHFSPSHHRATRSTYLHCPPTQQHTVARVC